MVNNISGYSADDKEMDIVALSGGIAMWCQCLSGLHTIRHGLVELATGFGAEVARLVRIDSEGGRSVRSIQSVVGSGLHIDDRPLSDKVVGAYISHAKVGSVWFASFAADESTSAIERINRQSGLAETAVFVISQDKKWTHLLELGFRNRFTTAKARAITALAGTLAQTWAARSPGLFTSALLQNRPAKPNRAFAAPILSDSNPARLSRAEFRLCLLLSDGLSLERVQEELNIKAATLRSHLRQIRAKTDVSNTNELVHSLLQSNFRPGVAGREALRQVAS